MTFKALLASGTGEEISTRVVETIEQDLMPGDVTNITNAFMAIVKEATMFALIHCKQDQ